MTSATGLSYRPGLDGLRAVAVIAVLLYHGQVGWARGGFLGVDVFFVLSGYLITGLLLAEWRRWGSIDLRGFWLRRARRLLPALFLLLAGVSAGAAVLASPAQRGALRGDALATLGYVANWRFVLADRSYFAQYDEPSPLRHMWSLGIEEQFYLLYPLLLIGLLTLGLRRRGLALVLGLGALGSAGLAAALYTPGLDPSRVYYGTDTRLQALLVGAVAAVLAREATRPRPPARDAAGARPPTPEAALARPPARDAAGARPPTPEAALTRPPAQDAARARPPTPEAALARPPAQDAARARPPTPAAAQARPRARSATLAGRTLPLPGRDWAGPIALAGLAVVLVAGRDTAGWLYRGGFLLVALLSVVVVVGAADDRSSTARLLSWEPLRQVGLVSYGLYLWHWPVYVVLTPDRVGATGPALLVLRLAVTGAFAAASYVLVEQPIRTGRRPTRRPGRLRALVAASVVAVLALVLGGTAGAGPPAGAPVAAAAPQERKPGDVAVYLLGDSVPYSLRTGFRPETVPGLYVAGSTQLGCGLVPVPISVDGQTRALDERCRPWDAAWPADVAAVRPDVAVLFAGVGEQFDHVVDGRTVTFGTPDYERHLVAALDSDTRRLGLGTRPVALVTVGCHRVADSGLDRDPAIVNDPDRVRWLNGVLTRYASARGLPLLDLYGFLCPGGYRAALDGVTLRSDGLHFTESGAAVVWRWLGPQLVRLARP